MKQHLQKVDFLRGIAILVVFVFHSQFYLFPGFQVMDYKENGVINISGKANWILNFSPTSYGWSGVFLFLIISGFLIHLGFLKNESNFKTSTFFSKRFWRIFPPYWLSLLFIVIVGWYHFTNKAGITDFTLHFFTLHNLTDPTFYSINPSYWSLALEVQLYLLYPILLYIRRKMGIRTTLLLTLGLSFILLLIGIKFSKLGAELSYMHSVFKLWFVWVAGAYFAELWFNGKRIFKRGSLGIAALLFLLMITAKYYIYANYLSHYLATFAWIMFLDWFLHAERIKMNSIVSKAVITVGLCSYSIYLIHQPYLGNMITFFNMISSKHAVLQVVNVIPVFLIIFLISWSLYQFIELSSIAFGEKLRTRNNKK